MIRRLIRNGAPTPLGAFCLALLVRLCWVTLVADPILYGHPYQYFANSLWLAESPRTLDVVLLFDNWRVQYDRWTAAPLYYLFLTAIFKIFGPGLTAVFWIQCGLGAAANAALTAIGARLGGARGRRVGWLYAFYLPAVQVCGNTLTEALHTPLLLISFAALLGSAASPSRHFVTGAIHGLAALTRSVSSAFFVLLALHRVMALRFRRAILPVVALTLGGSCVILPWTARNYVLLDEPILIETFAFENLWFSNAFVKPGFKEQQRQDIVARPTLREQRQAAVDWTWRNLRRSPEKILPKIVDNFEHLLRPDGLHLWAGARATMATWRHVMTVLFEDIPWFLGWMGLISFFLWSRRGPARLLLMMWLGYSLLMLVVVFQNEVRYRSILAPFIFAAAFSSGRRGPKAGRLAALGASAALICTLGTGRLALDSVRLALGTEWFGATTERESRIAHAFEAIRGGRLDGASRGLEGMGRAVDDVRGPMGRAWLSAEAGDGAVTRETAREFHDAEWAIDPTLLQEAAWEMLPPPARDLIEVGGPDVGAIRGFSYPWSHDRELPKTWAAGDPEDDTPHRWTRRRSWIRMRPSFRGPATLTIRMGVPAPFQGDAPTIQITAGGVSQGFPVSASMTDYPLDLTLTGPDLVIRIDSPTWNRSDQPADQGVRVEWVRLTQR